MDESDKIRRVIEARIAAYDAAGDQQRGNKTWLSHRLGRGPSYISDYLRRSPKNLSYEDRMTLAKVLDIDPRDVGIAPITQETEESGAGLENDVSPYHAPPGHFLEAVALNERFLVNSPVLDEHPDRIQAGDVLILDLSVRSPQRLKTLDVVVAMARDRRDLAAPARAVLRMFVAPNKLATNSSGKNEIVSLDDTSLPYEYDIKGRLQTVMRNTRQNSRHA